MIYTFLGSIFEPCCAQNNVTMNRVIKRFACFYLSHTPHQQHHIEMGPLFKVLSEGPGLVAQSDACSTGDQEGVS